MNRGEVLKKLEYTGRTPSLIENLGIEVDIRFVDPDICRAFEERAAARKKVKPAELSDEEIYARFRETVAEFYNYDPEFARSVRMPLTSYKQNKKFSGAVTKENPVTIREIDGQQAQLRRVFISALKPSQLKDVYTQDTDLTESLRKLFFGYDEKLTAGDILKKQGKCAFVTEKGNKINKVTLKAAPANYFIKEISGNNQTSLSNGEYYCVEFYKDITGKLRLRGIMYSDLVKKQGKLWLREKHEYPDDYASHVMYLQKNEYFEVKDAKGKIKEKSGYFVSIYSINQGALRTARFNTLCDPKKCLSISKDDSVRKIDIDILGYRGGEIKCGEPLLSLREKK